MSYQLSKEFVNIHGKMLTFDFVRRPVWTPGATAPRWDSFFARDHSAEANGEHLDRDNKENHMWITTNDGKTSIPYVPFPAFNLLSDPCSSWVEWVPFTTSDEPPIEVRVLGIRQGFENNFMKLDGRVATKIDLRAWRNTAGADPESRQNYGRGDEHGSRPALELNAQQDEMVRRICRRIGNEFFALRRQLRSRSNSPAPRDRSRAARSSDNAPRTPSPRRNRREVAGGTTATQDQRPVAPSQHLPMLPNAMSGANTAASLLAQLLGANQMTGSQTGQITLN